MKFIFDLDGTITSQEILPVIAKHFKMQEEIEILTTQTVRGSIPFVESFIRRAHILGRLPTDEINMLLGQIPLYPLVHDFIQNHLEDCVIVTENVSAWVDKLCQKAGCRAFCSEGLVVENRIQRLISVLKKERIVEEYKGRGEKVVFIGGGNSDMEAMRLADVSIASGLTHYPAKGILTAVNYLVFKEETLCRQLNQLC